jgi:glycosyltransferase involved in cell wall biosynthesis
MSILKRYNVIKDDFYLLIARMEPENNIEVILDGIYGIVNSRRILVIGSIMNPFGERLKKKYSSDGKIVFLGSIYDLAVLNTLRTFCCIYFHGHSVGGTNPSLLEAMACGALICAHDNGFNRAVLKDDAFYFYSGEEITNIIQDQYTFHQRERMVANNLQKIKTYHNWDNIINEYEQLFLESIQPLS